MLLIVCPSGHLSARQAATGLFSERPLRTHPTLRCRLGAQGTDGLWQLHGRLEEKEKKKAPGGAATSQFAAELKLFVVPRFSPAPPFSSCDVEQSSSAERLATARLTCGSRRLDVHRKPRNSRREVTSWSGSKRHRILKGEYPVSVCYFPTKNNSGSDGNSPATKH